MIQCVSDWNPYDDDPDFPEFYKCEKCGKFLKHKPDGTISGEDESTYEDIDGSFYTEHWSWTKIHRMCKCGHNNVTTEV